MKIFLPEDTCAVYTQQKLKGCNIEKNNNLYLHPGLRGRENNFSTKNGRYTLGGNKHLPDIHL